MFVFIYQISIFNIGHIQLYNWRINRNLILNLKHKWIIANISEMNSFFSFRAPLRKRIIMLGTHNKIENANKSYNAARSTKLFDSYTFLETNVDNFRFAVNQLKFRHIQGFKKLNQMLAHDKPYSQAIKLVQNIDFSEKDIVSIDQVILSKDNTKKLFRKCKQNASVKSIGQSNKIIEKYNKMAQNVQQSLTKSTFNRNKHEVLANKISYQTCCLLKQFSIAYMQAKNQFITNIRRHNIIESLKNASDMNFMHLEVNQRLFYFISQSYKQQPSMRKRNFVNYLIRYRMKFRYFSPDRQIDQQTFQTPNFKFNILGSHQRDLINFNELVKKLDDVDDYNLFKHSLIAKNVKQGDIIGSEKSQKRFPQRQKIGQQSTQNLVNYQHTKQQLLFIFYKLHLINSKFDLFFRWSKVMDINIYWIRKQFSGSRSNDIALAFTFFQDRKIQFSNEGSNGFNGNQRMLNVLLNITNFLGFALVDAPFAKMQDSIFKIIKNTFPDSKQMESMTQQRSKKILKVVYKILANWKNQSSFNHNLFFQFVQPMITKAIQDKVLETKVSINYVCFNMLCSSLRIQDQIAKTKVQDLVIRIVEYAQQKRIRQNSSMHLVKHYLRIKCNDRWTSKWNDLWKCRFVSHMQNCKRMQNIKVLNCMSQQLQNIKRQQKNYSINECLQIKSSNQITTQSSIQPNLDKRVRYVAYSDKRKIKNIQYNDVQKFWQISVRKLLPAHYIVFNAPFCDYEIDILVTAKGHLIAIQIQGSQYNTNINDYYSFNKSILDSQIKVRKQQILKQKVIINEKGNEDSEIKAKNGKKMLKEVILKHYGITLLRVKCWGPQQHLIMKSKDFDKAKQYISSRIEDLTNKQLHQLFDLQTQNKQLFHIKNNDKRQ